jgi:hypothetical protein
MGTTSVIRRERAISSIYGDAVFPVVQTVQGLDDLRSGEDTRKHLIYVTEVGIHTSIPYTCQKGNAGNINGYIQRSSLLCMPKPLFPSYLRSGISRTVP